jgi:quercetin dioxygenase-like cupin family protein
MTAAVFEAASGGETAENPAGGQLAFKVRGRESGGRLTAFETSVAPGHGPPLHCHSVEDETLYVIEGEFRFRLGGVEHVGGPGSFAFVPHGVDHTFQNVSDETGRMLIHFTPAGMERFFERFDELGSATAGAFERLAPEVGMEVLGPPLGG